MGVLIITPWPLLKSRNTDCHFGVSGTCSRNELAHKGRDRRTAIPRRYGDVVVYRLPDIQPLQQRQPLGDGSGDVITSRSYVDGLPFHSMSQPWLGLVFPVRYVASFRDFRSGRSMGVLIITP